MATTETRSRTHSEALEDWALRTLACDDDAPTGLAPRELWFRCLREEEFMPRPDQRVAWGVLQNDRRRRDQPHIPPHVLRELGEAELGAEVEAFARRFFTLKSRERRANYHQLYQQCASYPHLAMRLKQLQRGLHVDTSRARGDHSLAPLVSQIEAAFVATPAQRSQVWRRLLEEANENPKQWEKRVLTLDARHASVAKLQPFIVERLSRRAFRGTIDLQAAAARARGRTRIDPKLLFIFAMIGVAFVLTFAILIWLSTVKSSQLRPIRAVDSQRSSGPTSPGGGSLPLPEVLERSGARAPTELDPRVQPPDINPRGSQPSPWRPPEVQPGPTAQPTPWTPDSPSSSRDPQLDRLRRRPHMSPEQTRPSPASPGSPSAQPGRHYTPPHVGRPPWPNRVDPYRGRSPQIPSPRGPTPSRPAPRGPTPRGASPYGPSPPSYTPPGFP